MAAHRRRQSSLVLLLLLGLVYLILNARTLNTLGLLHDFVAPVVSFSSSSASANTTRTSHKTDSPWRIRDVEPILLHAQSSCDSSAPQQWPEWMRPSSSKETAVDSSSTTYRSILEEFPRHHNAQQSLDFLPPLKILEDYRNHHSVESLTRNPGCRKFLIATYRCPQSAGNRLHEFANSYFLAVLLNRTLLYKYLDQPYCNMLQQKFQFVNEEVQCTMNNTVRDCAKILDRAPWIPSYDEWQRRLGLPPTQYMTVGDFGPQSHHLLSPVGMDVAYNDVMVLAVRPLSRRFDAFARYPYTRTLKLKRNDTLERVDALFSMGHRFLFGLLFRSAFDIRPEIRTRQQTIPARNDSNSDNSSFTMAIHSRHIFPDDDGCNMTLEEDCLREIQQQTVSRNVTTASCVITLMSDRPCTLTVVRDYVANSSTSSSVWSNCSVIVADHDEGTGLLSEHGPFAGAGFFHDLAMTSSIARTAMIGSTQPPQFDTWRTSSELLEELIEYFRFMEAWQQGKDARNISSLLRCGLKRG